MRPVRIVDRLEYRLLGSHQIAEGLPGCHLAIGIADAAHDAAVAHRFLQLLHIAPIAAVRLGEIFGEQVEILFVFDHMLGFPKGVLVRRAFHVQGPFGRFDIHSIMGHAVCIFGEILAGNDPVLQCLVAVKIPAGSIEHHIHAEVFVRFDCIAPAQVRIQIVLHPVVHLAGQPLRLFIVDCRQKQFSRGHHCCSLLLFLRITNTAAAAPLPTMTTPHAAHTPATFPTLSSYAFGRRLSSVCPAETRSYT